MKRARTPFRPESAGTAPRRSADGRPASAAIAVAGRIPDGAVGALERRRGKGRRGRTHGSGAAGALAGLVGVVVIGADAAMATGWVTAATSFSTMSAAGGAGILTVVAPARFRITLCP